MINNDFFKEVKIYVFELFKDQLPNGIVYHNQNHTLQVVNASNEIALVENVSDEDLEILLLAAWFHDIGFTDGFVEHEERSKAIVDSLKDFEIKIPIRLYGRRQLTL